MQGFDIPLSQPYNAFQAHMREIQFLDSDAWLQNLDKVRLCCSKLRNCLAAQDYFFLLNTCCIPNACISCVLLGEIHQ